MLHSLPLRLHNCRRSSQNIIPLANELKGVTQAKVDTVALASIAAAFAVYLCVAVAGYKHMYTH